MTQTKDYKIKMRINTTERTQNEPQTLAEAWEIIKNTGNYPSRTTFRKMALEDQNPEIRLFVDAGAYRFQVIAERVKK